MGFLRYRNLGGGGGKSCLNVFMYQRVHLVFVISQLDSLLAGGGGGKSCINVFMNVFIFWVISQLDSLFSSSVWI